MASLASAGAPYEAEGASPLTRMLLTFTAPSRAFARLGSGGSWWLPFLLVVLVSLSYTATIGARVGWETVARTNLASSPKQQAQVEKAPAAQQAATLAMIARIARTSAYAISFAGPLVFGSIAAGILVATLRVGFGGKGTFGAFFAVYQYAALPGALKVLLVIATLCAGVRRGCVPDQQLTRKQPGILPARLGHFTSDFVVVELGGCLRGVAGGAAGDRYGDGERRTAEGLPRGRCGLGRALRPDWGGTDPARLTPAFKDQRSIGPAETEGVR